MKNSGLITKTINTPTASSASGVWSLQEQYEAETNDSWPKYLEPGPWLLDGTFSMDSLTSTGSVDNGLALSTDGGLIISKKTVGTQKAWWTYNHGSPGTGWGAVRHLKSSSSTSKGPEFGSGSLIEFKSGNGFNWQSASYTGQPIDTFSFKNTAGFFQVIKYSGNGASGTRQINHNLGCEWGWAVIKQRNDANSDHNWVLMSPALANDEARADAMLRINTSDDWDSDQFGDPAGGDYNTYKTTAINVRNIDYGGTSLPGNATGVDYVMFVWAHNPTNGIYCGVFNTDASGNYTHSTIGFEPRFGIFKDTDNNNADYHVLSELTGWGTGADTVWSINDDAGASSTVDYGAPTSNGFTWSGTPSTRYVFMVII